MDGSSQGPTVARHPSASPGLLGHLLPRAEHGAGELLPWRAADQPADDRLQEWVAQVRRQARAKLLRPARSSIKKSIYTEIGMILDINFKLRS